MLKIGTVTDNQDPDGLRRIRVTTVDRGVSSSQWLSRVTNFDGDDLPSPMIGSSVIVCEVAGDSTEDVILGVLQTATTNRPIEDKPDRESWWSILREIGFWVNNRFSVQSPSPNKPKISLNRDGTILASNSLGSVVLSPTGYMTVTNPSGVITMGDGVWNILTSGTLNVTSPGFKWNGQTVAVVGGTDSDGDVTLS